MGFLEITIMGFTMHTMKESCRSSTRIAWKGRAASLDQIARINSLPRAIL